MKNKRPGPKIGSKHIKKMRTKPGETGLNQVFHRYKKNAEVRNISFNLTLDDIRRLTSQNCFYCGDPPSMVALMTSSTASQRAIAHSKYVYNGVDRIDTQFGYFPLNCVPCCKLCNRAKWNFSKDEFFGMVCKIYAHHFSKKGIS